MNQHKPSQARSILLNLDGTFPKSLPTLSKHHWWHRGVTSKTISKAGKVEHTVNVCNKCGEILASFTHIGPFEFTLNRNDNDQTTIA